MGLVQDLLKFDKAGEIPQRFIQALSLRNATPEFREAAWKLFHRRKRLVTAQEIRDAMDRQKNREARAGEKEEDISNLKVGCINSHFLDSGSFSLWTRAAKYAKKHPEEGKWGFYQTQEFWDYVDRYAAFVKNPDNAVAIDLYANVDVIPNPKLSRRNLEYLQKKHGLNPVPVVHYTPKVERDLEVLARYIDEGHKIVALGGLVGVAKTEGAVNWLDKMFNLVCDTPDRKPRVKVHGFGITSYQLLLRFPWWSVDSTSWTKAGAYGFIFIPHKRNGTYNYHVDPYRMTVAIESPMRRIRGRHVLTLAQKEQDIIEEWLNYIGVPLGTFDKDTMEVKTFGVTTRHTERRAANLLFFEHMLATLPAYPWAFRTNPVKGFGF